MPKKGIVKCQNCDMEFEGMLPDNKEVGYFYISLDGEIDSGLIEKLQLHHLETAQYWSMFGHRHFDVFLENGQKGKLEANSYSVSYKEMGKERF